LKEGTVRLADVAEAAGVSRGTASNVFNRPQIVREEVRERVLETAQRLGYAGPDPRGRMLRAGKVNAIGVAGPWPLSYFFDDPFARLVMEGIGEVCGEAGAGISLISALDERQVSWSIQSALVDGFVLFCMGGGSRLVELTRERKLPFVALDFAAGEAGVSRIWVDDMAGARQAASHLLGLGHRDFAVLALPALDEGRGPVAAPALTGGLYPGPRDRIAGYFEALAQAGVDTGQVPIYETDNDERTTRAGMEFLFSGARRPTAVLAMSDRMALAALDWLSERGIAVPGGVSVIGFDGVPEGARSLPPLTTIAQPMLDKGRAAARMILDPEFRQRQIHMPLELVVRGSTGVSPR
jgi:DNA-binding LacI/PurR family transcriptional regulator